MIRLQIAALKRVFNDKDFHDKYFRYFGYASINKPEDVIPDVTISFYSFHFMVILGFLFIMIFSAALYLLFKGIIEDKRWFLWIALLSIPLALHCRRAGLDTYRDGPATMDNSGYDDCIKSCFTDQHRIGDYNIHSFCGSIRRIAHFRDINYG